MPPGPAGRGRLIAAAEALAAVLLLGAAWAEILTAPGWPGPIALDLVLAAAITVPTGLVSVGAEAAVGTVLGAVVLQALLFRTPQSIAELLAVVVALLQGTLRVRRFRGALGALAVVAGVLLVFRSEGGSDAPDTAFIVLVLIAPVLAGLLIRGRLVAAAADRERTRWAREQRLALAELAVRDERARIARELHDVVAHALSVAVVQAVGGRAVLPVDPAAAATAFDVIADTGGRALAELQRLLGALRDAGSGAAPGLDRLGDLLGSARAAGLRAELVVLGTPRPLAAGVELAAYRIVQEALTNAVKHAGQAAARVEVDWADGVALRIVNGPGTGPSLVAAEGGGHGIVGMRERAALCGGRLAAGATPDGGFAVTASLPGGVR